MNEMFKCTACGRELKQAIMATEMRMTPKKNQLISSTIALHSFINLITFSKHPLQNSNVK